MPSTYSTELRLEKQADGEGSATWGQKCNTVFEMIEDAIAGRAAVSMPADVNYTLTTANSATDEARMAILNIASGVSLTATRNVTVPTSAKTYTAKNATTGGQSIVVKTAAGTGVTIPNGKTTPVFCDATNVVDAIDYLSTLTVGNALTVSAGAVTITGGTLTTGAANSSLFNTTATTLAIGGAATTLTIGAATSSATWTGQAWTLTGANSTNNSTFTVSNSTDAGASHAILQATVGGVTSTGDPQLRLSIVGGTSWYVGNDNSDSDKLKIGTGTAVGTNTILTIDGSGINGVIGATTPAAATVTTLAIAEGAIISGVYTPTLTNTTNVDGSTAFECQYIRVGNVVTVSGVLNMDTTAATATVLGISLPIASNFGGVSDCGGTAVDGTIAGNAGAIYADVANDRARLETITATSTDRTWAFHFSYQVI